MSPLLPESTRTFLGTWRKFFGGRERPLSSSTTTTTPRSVIRQRLAKAAVRRSIELHEGGYQCNEKDPGNWFQGKLVGTNFGMTPATLARHRLAGPITAEVMKNITIETAVKIAYADYFAGPHLTELPWTPWVEAIFDFGLNAGPKRAISVMQDMVGTTPDGIVGPITVSFYNDFISEVEDDGKAALSQYCDERRRYYARLVMKRPRLKVFANGWDNRARYYLATNTDWTDTWTSGFSAI